MNPSTFDGLPEAGTALAHYGVKGMKWGVRKDDSSSSQGEASNGGGGGDSEEDVTQMTDEKLEQLSTVLSLAIAGGLGYLAVQEMADSVLDFGSKIADSLFGESESRKQKDDKRNSRIKETGEKIGDLSKSLKGLTEYRRYRAKMK